MITITTASSTSVKPLRTCRCMYSCKRVGTAKKLMTRALAVCNERRNMVDSCEKRGTSNNTLGETYRSRLNHLRCSSVIQEGTKTTPHVRQSFSYFLEMSRTEYGGVGIDQWVEQQKGAPTVAP